MFDYLYSLIVKMVLFVVVTVILLFFYSPWSSSFSTTNSFTTGFSTEPVDTLPPLNTGFAPLSSTDLAPTTTADPYDFSAFNAPLDDAGDQVSTSHWFNHN